jgi:membrane protein implicated in regulation of membrane protease activity
MAWSFWLILAIVFFITEIISAGMFFFACLGIGALLTALVVLITLPFWMQWVVFSVISLLSIYLIRPVAMRLFKPKEIVKSNVDSLIGKKALVIEAIGPMKPGMIKIDGELWRARAEEQISKDLWVEIVSVDGVHLKVKSINK